MALNNIELKVKVTKRWSYWPAMILLFPIVTAGFLGWVSSDFVGRLTCRYMLKVEVAKCN